jgi:hypothetical protein
MFAKEPVDAGVPLSQADMADVLLAFSCVTLYMIESRMVGDFIQDDERESMVHMWRLIGKSGPWPILFMRVLSLKDPLLMNTKQAQASNMLKGSWLMSRKAH